MRNACLLSQLKKSLQSESNEEKITQFYNNATEDYEFWSKDLNMHFGYYVPFTTNAFKRDSMLHRMNEQIFSQLNIAKKNTHVADLGCGMGATMKYGIDHYPELKVTGCTISPFQVTHGNKLLNSERAEIVEADYRNTKLRSDSFDGAYAIESFCHSGCAPEALKEAHRILKPEGTLVIADAFCKKPRSSMNVLTKKVHDKLSKSWSLEKLGNIKEVEQELYKLGFREVSVENIWYRVAPSVLHVPFAITGFILKKLFRGEPLKKESWDNLKGSFYALLTGLCLTDFGYYIITAKK